MSDVPSAPPHRLDDAAEWPGAGRVAPEAQLYGLGSFTVHIGERMLRREGAPVELGSRAFDLLVVLLQARGTVVSKRRITEAVWPGLVVDESNLRFQMACLRRALGAERDVIKTVQGRGYLLVADAVRLVSDAAPLPVAPLMIPRPAAEGPAVVAVVDDDSATREALDGLLRSSGFRVETYASSQAFESALPPSDAECLVLDVWMPGRSGLDFQSDLNANGADLPIIFISGHADVHMSVRAMKAGAVEFLTKPVRHQDLLEAIRSAVAARRDRGRLALA